MLVIALTYVALSAALTWPLVARLGSVLGGEQHDAIHSLWTSWWWHDCIERGLSPFSAEAVRQSSASVRWLRPFNIPAAIAGFPSWELSSPTPDLLLQNMLLLATIAAGGLSMFLLCRELWGAEWPAFLSGAVYAASAFRIGIGIGRLDLFAHASSPVFLLGVVHTLRRRGVAGPLLAGAALAISANSARGHLVFCAIGTMIVILQVLRAGRNEIDSPALARRAILAVVVFFAAGGWYALGPPMKAPGSIGNGELEPPSLDLLSFFVRSWNGRFEPGAPATAASAHIGYVLLLVAAYGLLRVKATRLWLLAAALGVLLALGSQLTIARRAFPGLYLPLGWANFSGSLDRLAASAEFAWLVVLGLSVALGGVLAAIVRNIPRGRLVATAIVVAALIETWPRATVAEPPPAPRFLRDLTRDRERWAVLDLTRQVRQQWNQMLHRHGVIDEAFAARLPRSGDALMRSSAVGMLELSGVRFVIASEDDTSLAWLGLPAVFRGDGLMVFEVPPRTVQPVRLGSARP